MAYKDLFSLDANSWANMFGDNQGVAGGLPAIGLAAYIPTCGTRAGPNSDGVLLGAFTPTAVGSAQKALTGGTVYTSYTTAANNATTGDVTFDFGAVDDALYISHATQKFSAIKITYSVAGVYVATLVWEYWNGTAWTSLATSNLLTDSTASSGAALKATAGTKLVTFRPPTDWATTTVNSVSGYHVRLHCTAWTSTGTAPVLDQLWVYPLGAGAGPSFGVGGTLKSIDFTVAATKSASNNDSKFLLANGTTGQTYLFTATKAVADTSDTSPTLSFAATDQLVVQQVAQDGTTEFSGVNLHCLLVPHSA